MLLRYSSESLTSSFCLMLLSQDTNSVLVLTQNGVASHLNLLSLLTCSLPTDHQLCRVENFSYYIFFRRLRTLPTQFTWHIYCHLFTLIHRCPSCLKIHKLTGLSKVKTYHEERWSSRLTIKHLNQLLPIMPHTLKGSLLECNLLSVHHYKQYIATEHHLIHSHFIRLGLIIPYQWLLLS